MSPYGSFAPRGPNPAGKEEESESQPRPQSWKSWLRGRFASVLLASILAAEAIAGLALMGLDSHCPLAKVVFPNFWRHSVVCEDPVAVGLDLRRGSLHILIIRAKTE